jgi:hypothetical protein
MIEARFQYFADPHPGKHRTRAAFKANYANTLDLLEAELRRISAHDITIHAGFPTASIRNDGWPKSSARAEHPACIVSFERGNRREAQQLLSFPCDTYDRYESNLRAIALSLEALRAVDRYGVSQGTEQYVGWAKLAAPGQADSIKLAAQFFHDAAPEFSTSDIAVSVAHFNQAYRAAAKRFHPDGTGADRDKWEQMQNYRRILEAHHQ